MKKTVIAAGAASVALAAMPIVGAFALGGTVIDNINVTVGDGCTVTNENTERTVTLSATAGAAAVTADGDVINLVCNTTDWIGTAQGTGLNGATDLYKDASNKIATGATYSGDTSAWGFKLTSEGGAVASAYTDYAPVPASAAQAITGVAKSATITPSYTVFAAADQEAGAYTGQVTYVFAVNE